MNGQAGVPARISVVQAVHRLGHGSKRTPRPVAGPVLILFMKRKRVTEMAVKTVALQTAMTVAVDRDMSEDVVSTVS